MLFWRSFVKMSLNSAEIEFLAENELVNIIPNFNHDKLYLIGGDVGPFRAGMPLEVPIWLAVNLDRRHKCRILTPDWLNVEKLEQVKEDESQSQFFTLMPNLHFMVVAQLLMTCRGIELQQGNEIKMLLKDIWDIRQSKLRSSIDAFIKSEGTHAKLDHLTAMEINTIRPFLPQALDQIYRIKKTAAVIDDQPSQASSV